MTLKFETGPARIEGDPAEKYIRQIIEANFDASDGTNIRVLGKPIRGYMVDSVITSENFIETAKPHSWWFELVEGDTPRALGVLQTPDRQDKDGRVDSGIPAARMLDALKLAQDKFADAMETYEPRILQIASQGGITLWLHGDGKNDIFVPVLRSQFSQDADAGVKPSVPVAIDPGFLSKAVQIEKTALLSGIRDLKKFIPMYTSLNLSVVAAKIQDNVVHPLKTNVIPRAKKWIKNNIGPLVPPMPPGF